MRSTVLQTNAVNVVLALTQKYFRKLLLNTARKEKLYVYVGQDAASAFKDKTITLIDLDFYTAWKQLSDRSVTRGINRTCRSDLTIKAS